MCYIGSTEDEELALMLAGNASIDLDLKDINNQTAIHIAGTHIGRIYELLNLGATIPPDLNLDLIDPHEMQPHITLLMYAALQKNLFQCQELIQAGAKINITTSGENNYNALEYMYLWTPTAQFDLQLVLVFRYLYAVGETVSNLDLPYYLHNRRIPSLSLPGLWTRSITSLQVQWNNLRV